MQPSTSLRTRTSAQLWPRSCMAVSHGSTTSLHGWTYWQVQLQGVQQYYSHIPWTLSGQGLHMAARAKVSTLSWTAVVANRQCI